MRVYGAYIIVTYGKGRNIKHEKKYFRTRETAKAYAKKFLDNDVNISRYTIYDN